MNYDDFYTSAHVGAELVDKGELDKAREVFERLAASDISPLDRANMLRNVATVLEKQGRKQDAIAVYDRAIALEQPFCRNDALERKAVLLAESNQTHASIALYEELLRKPWTTEDQKYRCRTNIDILRQRL
jgi:tetratricopeptide (TPR) repeat protein